MTILSEEEEKDELEEKAPAPSAKENSVIDHAQVYKTHLLKSRFEFISITRHSFLTQYKTDQRQKSSNLSSVVKRVHKELCQLKVDLPFHIDASIFIRCDDNSPQVMKFLMTGPRGTPYDSGCFEFDVYCPRTYPRTPPLVKLITTGNGSVRFNPNLYNNGKVCLSLLGTWAGKHQNETWCPTTSSVWQVVVSIQSAILGMEFPYFNEPGIENTEGTSCRSEEGLM